MDCIKLQVVGFVNVHECVSGNDKSGDGGGGGGGRTDGGGGGGDRVERGGDGGGGEVGVEAIDRMGMRVPLMVIGFRT